MAPGPRLLGGNFSPPSPGSTEYQGSAPGVPSAPSRAAPPPKPRINNGLQECVARSRTEGRCAIPGHKGDCLVLFFVFFFLSCDAKRCFRHPVHNTHTPRRPQEAKTTLLAQPSFLSSALNPAGRGSWKGPPGWAAAPLSLRSRGRRGFGGEGGRRELDRPETGGQGKGLLRETRARQRGLGSH